MKNVAVLLIAMTSLISGCVVYDSPYRDGGGRHVDRDHENRPRDHDRDRDGLPDRVDRDRDGDGVPNRQDRRPDDQRRN